MKPQGTALSMKEVRKLFALKLSPRNYGNQTDFYINLAQKIKKLVFGRLFFCFLVKKKNLWAPD